jgi:hypothetical protein
MIYNKDLKQLKPLRVKIAGLQTRLCESWLLTVAVLLLCWLPVQSSFGFSCVVLSNANNAKHLRAKFANSEIVAEAVVITVGEVLHTSWDSVQLVEVKVTQYLRKPSKQQASHRYLITMSPDSTLVGEKLLLFARAEPRKNWRERQEISNTNGEIPSHIKHRVWYSDIACSQGVYRIANAEMRKVVRLTRSIARQFSKPARLRLKFTLKGLAIRPAAKIIVRIRQRGVGGSLRRVRLGNLRQRILLPAGRYKIQWPTLEGFEPPCSRVVESDDCELELVHGGNHLVQMTYRSSAMVGIETFDANKIPKPVLGELKWRRMDGKPSFPADGVQFAGHQNMGIESPVIPGRYRLFWVVNQFAQSKVDPSAEITDCSEVSRKEITVRWQVNKTAINTEHSLRAGKNWVRAYVPQVKRVSISSTAANRYVISAKLLCTKDIRVFFSSQSAALIVYVLAGQAIEVQYRCKNCASKSTLVTKRLLVDGDLDLVFD